MPLPRKARADVYEPVIVNVYELGTKEIVFTGGQRQAAQFMGVNHRHMGVYLSQKTKIKKKYTVRLAKTQQ
jgi:hypothetical protein